MGQLASSCFNRAANTACGNVYKIEVNDRERRIKVKILHKDEDDPLLTTSYQQ
jgi:hypothetical protein